MDRPVAERPPGGHRGPLVPPLAAGPLSTPALTGTFITHSCAVLCPTDCGKPIWLQEVPSQGHSPPDPHTQPSPPDTHILCSAGGAGRQTAGTARGPAGVSCLWQSRRGQRVSVRPENHEATKGLLPKARTGTPRPREGWQLPRTSTGSRTKSSGCGAQGHVLCFRLYLERGLSF